jgi:hypothetical protein
MLDGMLDGTPAQFTKRRETEQNLKSLQPSQYRPDRPENMSKMITVIIQLKEKLTIKDMLVKLDF